MKHFKKCVTIHHREKNTLSFVLKKSQDDITFFLCDHTKRTTLFSSDLVLLKYTA